MEIDKSSKYEEILTRIHKQFLLEEGFILIIRLYLTDNIFYYILCILFRFIPLIIISGNYNSKNRNDLSKSFSNIKSFNEIINVFTCHNLVLRFKF